MALLYVASTETFVGKSAVCVGILDRVRRDGSAAGYMKPVSVAVARAEDLVLDDDAGFIRQHFGLADPLERIAPVQLTPSVIEHLLRGQAPDLSRKLRDAYVALSRDKDLVILEGANQLVRRLAGGSLGRPNHRDVPGAGAAGHALPQRVLARLHPGGAALRRGSAARRAARTRSRRRSSNSRVPVSCRSSNSAASRCWG